MELRQIRTFVTAARLLNFRHAASELGITQPAVSQQIRAMEVELGFDIFQRQARGVVLTPAGEQMFAALRQVNDSAEAMYAAARMTRRGEMG
ncbi:LysR family transcriptional regulator, partial [Thioclava sp. BHET1]